MAMNSKNACDWIRIYAAKGQEQQAMRVYIENRVSMQNYMKALREGRAIRSKMEHKAASANNAHTETTESTQNDLQASI
jgi:FKBP-type peptidyl-prolyl cis-trans isomerase